MIAVIFEVEPAAGKRDAYLGIAADLSPHLSHIDGFISVERFESLSTPGKLLSFSIWRDEEAISAWRNTFEHREAQRAGRGGVFADYRLRIAHVVRDYGITERAQAPEDSRIAHRDPEPRQREVLLLPRRPRAGGTIRNQMGSRLRGNDEHKGSSSSSSSRRRGPSEIKMDCRLRGMTSTRELAGLNASSTEVECKEAPRPNASSTALTAEAHYFLVVLAQAGTHPKSRWIAAFAE